MSNTTKDEEIPATDPTGEETQPVSTPDLRQDLLKEIGNKLAAARLALLEELDEPARKLKLRKKHLEALESGDWECMPDEVYAMGFLRQYSAYLGLDLTEEVERLKNSAYTLTRPLTFPDPPVAPSRQWAWVAAGMFIVLIVAFNILYQQDPETHHPSPAPATETNNDSDMFYAPRSKQSATASADTSNLSEAEDDSIMPSDAERDQEYEAMQSASITTEGADEDTSIASPEPVAAAAAIVLHNYRFEAVDSAVWIQVSLPNSSGNGKGRLIKEVLLQQGHQINLSQPVNSLWITCGNAPALRITIDNKVLAETGSLGTGKKVLRDHRISINEEQ